MLNLISWVLSTHCNSMLAIVPALNFSTLSQLQLSLENSLPKLFRIKRKFILRMCQHLKNSFRSRTYTHALIESLYNEILLKRETSNKHIRVRGGEQDTFSLKNKRPYSLSYRIICFSKYTCISSMYDFLW